MMSRRISKGNPLTKTTRALQLPGKNSLHIKIDPYSSLLFACCTKESVQVWYLNDTKKDMEKISEHAMHPNQTRSSFAHMDFSNGVVLLTGNFRGKPKRKGKNGILSQVEPNIFVKAIIIRKKSSSSTSYVSLCDDLIDLELPIAVQMWQQVSDICVVESPSSTENLCFLASKPEGNIVLLEYRFRSCSEDSRVVISPTAKRAKLEETLENDSSKPMEMEQIACHVLPPAYGFGKLKHLAANRQVNSLACGMFDNAVSTTFA